MLKFPARQALQRVHSFIDYATGPARMILNDFSDIDAKSHHFYRDKNGTCYSLI